MTSKIPRVGEKLNNVVHLRTGMIKKNRPEACILLDTGLEEFKKRNLVQAATLWLGAIKDNILIVPRLVCVDDPLVYLWQKSGDESESWRYLNSRWTSQWRYEKDAWFALTLLWHTVTLYVQTGQAIDKDPSEIATFIKDSLMSTSPEAMAAKQALEILYAHARFIRETDSTGNGPSILRLPAKRKNHIVDCLLEAESFISRFANHDILPHDASVSLKKLEITRETQQKIIASLGE